MQREPLFRAKSETGHWHEGQFSYGVIENKVLPLITSVFEVEKDIVNAGGTRVIATSIPVMVNTLGQYTFQEYYNGKAFIKVFTGDVGEFEHLGKSVRGVAKQSITGAFYLDTGKWDDPNNHQLWWVEAYKKIRWIGNVHDNPELLTTKQ